MVSLAKLAWQGVSRINATQIVALRLHVHRSDSFISSFQVFCGNTVHLASRKVNLRFWTAPGWFPIRDAAHCVLPYVPHSSLHTILERPFSAAFMPRSTRSNCAALPRACPETRVLDDCRIDPSPAFCLYHCRRRTRPRYTRSLAA
jgi:hypothetical protein